MIKVTNEMVWAFAESGARLTEAEIVRGLERVAAVLNERMARYVELDAQTEITDDESRELADLVQMFAPLHSPSELIEERIRGRQDERNDFGIA